jgi:hypothetical protein
MTRVAESLETPLRLPDLWQQRAIRALQAGRDVVVDAPTGAGKTYIFEMLVESGLRTDAIYTVPTRALANDKRQEWRENRWNVGIVTGDLTENTDAPVIVATLETQKHRFLAGKGPGLLVVDEYQMLGDQSRGVNYELALALAPRSTQLLLLSGSVANPGEVAAWLRRLGRQVELIQHTERPVPLEEVRVEALPDRGIPTTVKGFWPRAIAKALAAGMAPLLAFAPRRKSAEALALQIARMLPEEDPLVLTPEQQRLAGDSLTRLLRARVAYHHSGLDYRQRAGLIEPLAKAGQLRVVVATMGLSSGINFSMRSVLVTDREYRSGDGTHLVRPDELLQMFGRAGRRGLDKKGYVLVAPGKPRVSESRPLSLRRSAQIDWPSLIAVMQAAVERNEDPTEAARALSARLFSPQRIPLGLDQFHRKGPRPAAPPTVPTRTQTIVEFQRPDGEWERQRSPRRIPLGEALWFEDNTWMPALARPGILRGVEAGTLCHLGEDAGHRLYGREVPLARLGRDDSEGELVLTRWTAHGLRELQTNGSQGKPIRRKRWTLHDLENRFVPHLPRLTHGGTFAGLEERNDMLYARLDYRLAETFAYIDTNGQALINPPTRSVDVEVNLHFAVAPQTPERLPAHTVADAWFDLGLMDHRARPTLRGRLFSFFNHGEGLALAAALEDAAYPLDELVFDIANLRAGHRFSEHETFSSRLGNLCRTTFRNATFPGYLRKGVPEDYGDGAAEILLHLADKPGARRQILSEDLSSGDIERARLEWRSLLNHIAHAPDLEWERWLDFRRLCRETLYGLAPPAHFGEFPPLTNVQRKRHRSFLRFD